MPVRKKYGECWNELGPKLSTEIQAELKAGEAAVLVGEALVDGLKSDVDVSNFDIPKVPGSLF